MLFLFDMYKDNADFKVYNYSREMKKTISFQ